jgi:small basic protein
MKVSLPIYVVALFVSFVVGALKAWKPDLPITEDLVQYVILAILAALGVDVTAALRANGTLR